MADMSFNIACKELKIAQLNQLFQFLHLVYDIRRRLLWVKSYTKEEKCKQWRQQRFSFIERFYSNDFMGREGKAIISSISFPASLWASTLLCQLQNSFIIYFLTCPFIYWFAQSGENKLGKSDPYFVFPAYYKRRIHLFIQSGKNPKQSAQVRVFFLSALSIGRLHLLQSPIGWLDCPCLCNWPEGFQTLLAKALILLTINHRRFEIKRHAP